MRKRIMAQLEKAMSASEQEWLNVERLAEVEITSEGAAHPMEFALLPGRDSGWRAAGSKQTIRLLFNRPQRLRRIWMNIVESGSERTQEYGLQRSPDSGQSFKEIVRQQWNFNPRGATNETEDHHVELPAGTVLELSLIPDIGGGNAPASLAQLRFA